MVTASQEYDMQRALAGLRVTVQKRMTAALRVVAEQYAGDPRRFRDAAIGVMQNLTKQYGRQAGEFAAQWYNAMRVNEGIRDRFVARGYIGDYDVEVAETIRRTVAELFTQAPDLEAVFESITARASKYVADDARETVRRNAGRDPRARGWRRVAHGETCDFCLMLVGRGGVYTDTSVRFASHTHCNCGAVPEWNQNVPEVPSIAYRASASRAGMSEKARARLNRNIQSWIADNQEYLASLRSDVA
jgi:hypothetical protein